MKKEIDILKISIKDYATKPMLKMILYPVLGTLVVLYISFFAMANIGLDSLENTQIQIQQYETKVENGEVIESETIESYTGSSILDFLLKYTVTSWIVSFIVYVLGLFLIGYISIFISLIIVGFLTPRILAIIHKRHYPSLEINSQTSILDFLFFMVKSFFILICLFIVLIPFYFIPIINIIAINIPFFYFFHKMLHFDIASTITSKEEFGQVYYPNKSYMRMKSLFLYAISLIPFTALFLSIFYIIYLGHTYFRKLENIKRT